MPPTYDNPHSPDAARAAQEAARWLAVLSDEQCSEGEREQFFQWLRSSTRHVDEFLRISTIARRAKQRSLWPDDSVESLIAAAAASANVAPLAGRATTQPPSARRGRARWAIAASLALAIGAGALIATKPQLAGLFDPTYVTAIGEQRSITLEDGSVVELNSKSRLIARFSRKLRAIELAEGEAIFRVAKDSSRAFRVRTGVTDIVAVGTAFNVNASDARTIVTVLEGRVHVRNRMGGASAAALAESFELTVGEQLIVSPAAPAIRVALHDTAKVTSWTERRLIFEDTAIGAIALEFARYSPREIRIEDPQLAARKITAVFDATDPASLVEFLETDPALEVSTEGDDWVVKTKSH